jgi:hypothetical protein
MRMAGHQVTRPLGRVLYRRASHRCLDATSADSCTDSGGRLARPFYQRQLSWLAGLLVFEVPFRMGYSLEMRVCPVAGAAIAAAVLSLYSQAAQWLESFCTALLLCSQHHPLIAQASRPANEVALLSRTASSLFRRCCGAALVATITSARSRLESDPCTHARHRRRGRNKRPQCNMSQKRSMQHTKHQHDQIRPDLHEVCCRFHIVCHEAGPSTSQLKTTGSNTSQLQNVSPIHQTWPIISCLVPW